jgi:hypothetical protein
MITGYCLPFQGKWERKAIEYREECFGFLVSSQVQQAILLKNHKKLQKI